jgi:UDP-glucose 4-epimerase
MARYDCKQLVFSSSATVYGNPKQVPITEDASLSATNPYGQTKLIGEQILRDLVISDPEFKVTILRYFNPVGAHESGLIGEDPHGTPNNLMPYVTQVAAGRREALPVFGHDYPTPDGTGVRDYLHVVDLAKAHVRALKHETKATPAIFNLGTGRGYSVLEVVKAFERASGKTIAYNLMDRRPGDIAECYADTKLAERELGWRAEKTLDDMCADAWRWQSQNPDGYGA